MADDKPLYGHKPHHCPGDWGIAMHLLGTQLIEHAFRCEQCNKVIPPSAARSNKRYCNSICGAAFRAAKREQRNKQ